MAMSRSRGLDVVDDPPGDLDFAAAHRLKPCDAAQERALAAARGANQYQQLTVGDIERDTMQDAGAAAALAGFVYAQAANADRGHARSYGDSACGACRRREADRWPRPPRP